MIPSFATIALGLLATQAAASEPAHHDHKREAAVEYVTVVQTAYITAGDADAPATETSVTSTVIAETEPVSPKVTSPEAPYEITSTSIAADTPVETSSSSSETSSASSSDDSSSSSSVSAGSAGALGVTYSPYTSSGGCKSAEQVAADVSALSGFSVIRLYGTDCNQVANVAAAKASGQKLFLGIYDVANIASGISDINSALNGDWSDVNTVSIGNELVNSGQATPDQISNYVAEGRAALKSTSYSGPVVSVDTFIAVIEHPDLCKCSDYMAVNAHAFFDGGVTSGDAGTWAVQQVQRVWEACGGEKSVTIVESGWPSQGQSNGVAVASPSDQSAAISAIKKSIGNDCYLFNAYNDLWKSPGYLGCEQYWGILGDSSS